MYLPTPITMPGARRIEVGNHSFLPSSRFTKRSFRNKSNDKHPSFDKRSPWGFNLRPPDPEADALSTRPGRPVIKIVYSRQHNLPVCFKT
ncbi:hypothetical protein DPMN_046280 [Dreissena polymorpha]|uniref:Uncharacterized protein n=1 Tax=Dreissena polymorpha TaxID=45954 RepID=A0A9D4D849_DREPO|nr:hypothetical protein DPMN_046280 [Dreissena polymorpha]